MRRFKDHVRDEYQRIAALPEEAAIPPSRERRAPGKQGACA